MDAGWSARHSSDYEGKRFVVDGDLIELYAYEYGVFQPDVAKDFHAEPLKEYESRWLDRWVKHHNRVLRRTCDAIENENAKLRELLSMYVSFARAFAEGFVLQSAYCDGMGKRMDETKMRECALELGVKECR